MTIKENKSHRGNKGIGEMTPKAISEHAGTLVRITDYDKNKHKLKVVKLADNQPLDPDQETEEKIEQKKLYDHPNTRTLKVSEAADGPIVEATEDYVSMRGNGDYGFFSYREGGANIIKGPLSIAAEPHQVRLAGLTTLNPLITSGFASTIVTPLPACVWSLPGAATIRTLLKDVLVAGTLMAAAGSAV